MASHLRIFVTQFFIEQSLQSIDTFLIKLRAMHPIMRPLRLRIRLIPDTFELISLRPCVICLEMLSKTRFLKSSLADCKKIKHSQPRGNPLPRISPRQTVECQLLKEFSHLIQVFVRFDGLPHPLSSEVPKPRKSM